MTGTLLRVSQSSFLLSQLQVVKLQFHDRTTCTDARFVRPPRSDSHLPLLSQRHNLKTRVVSDSNFKPSPTFIAQEQEVEIQPDTSGGGGGDDLGGGSGSGGGDDNNSNESEGGESGEGDNANKKMSMSQKLTLAYAALVGVGGVMGYLKSGSKKSLLAGGLSSLLLYYVYTVLPTRPAFASSLGLGLSAALLVVMGSRFKKSGKIFPAGVVSFVSLVMSGGYLHGILLSLH
ncbi:Protein FATTY ACID EXPORT 2 like [Actinidia chinensis var. chinensis]|uniref:Protein FATTY ACID EXPORT 2 like n=2 Tax=Actinidia TaxID=3624 RepID=A0A2R6PGD5_ACTCC|nr:Protein FATTY ACID EXPORT 2 like [Actinidia chinensis var. chinensis]